MRTRSATIGGQGEPMASDIANDCAGPPSNGAPPALRCAHRNLDRAVDRLYRSTPLASECERVKHLFALYEKMRAR